MDNPLIFLVTDIGLGGKLQFYLRDRIEKTRRQRLGQCLETAAFVLTLPAASFGVCTDGVKLGTMLLGFPVGPIEFMAGFLISAVVGVT